MQSLINIFNALFSYIIDWILKVFDSFLDGLKIVCDFCCEFINYSDGNKIAIFCGITAIIAPYIIFIAEIISSNDKDRNKTYKRIVLRESWMFKQLVLIMFIFMLMLGSSKCTYLLNIIVILLIFIEIIIFFWRFTIILSILNSSKFYKTRRLKYIDVMIEKYIKYNTNSRKIVEKNKKDFDNLQLSNVLYEKNYFDFKEEYEKVVAEQDGVIKGINVISFKEIDNILKNNIIGENKTNKHNAEGSRVIISYVDGEYVKKGSTIAYVPKKNKDIRKIFNKIEIKSERNNDEIIIDIFRDYLDFFVEYSNNSSSLKKDEAYFDFYEYATRILDSNDIDLIKLLQDSIGKMRFNVDRNCKTSIDNIISICKNLLIYDNKREGKDLDFEMNMINIIIYDSFELLSLCKDENARKTESMLFAQNVAAFINYKFKNQKEDIKNYFYTSISDYIKLVACSSYSERIELINIVISNLYFDKNDYDIWTVIHNKHDLKKTKSPKKIDLLKQNIDKLKYNIDLVNSFVLTTLLGVLYGDFDKDASYFDLLKGITDFAKYGYDLEEVLYSFLNFNKASSDVISQWGIIENPYDIVSNFNSIELKESLILFLTIAEIENIELGKEFIDIKYKYFFEDLIQQLNNSKNSDLMITYESINNGSIDKIIEELTRIYKLILKKEKSVIINAKLNADIVSKFSSIVSKQTVKNHHLYNYYINNGLFINARKQTEKYNGYNTVVDKEIFLSYDSIIINMAEDYRDGLIDHNEKIIVDSIHNCTTKIEPSSLDNGIEKSINKLLKDNVNPKDILIIGDFMYSSKINKKNKYYKYNGIRYKFLNEVRTNNKVYVIDKNSIPKLIVYKFNNKDLEFLHATDDNLKNNDKLFVKISDLSHDKVERNRILKEEPEWLKEEDNKEEYVKTKILIMVLQKVDIQPSDINIGYYFDN